MKSIYKKTEIDCIYIVFFHTDILGTVHSDLCCQFQLLLERHKKIETRRTLAFSTSVSILWLALNIFCASC